MGDNNLTVGITPAERIRRIQEARHLAECERDEAKARAERLQEEVEAMRAKNGVLWQKWHSLREKSDLDVAESELRLQTAQRLMAERDEARQGVERLGRYTEQVVDLAEARSDLIDAYHDRLRTAYDRQGTANALLRRVLEATTDGVGMMNLRVEIMKHLNGETR